MLARKFRLPASTLFQHSRMVREDLFTVKSQKNTMSHMRFGFVVSKTIDKRAVARNTLKRFVRGHIEKTYLILDKGIDVLFILRPAIKNVPKAEIIQKIDGVMQKVQAV